MTQTQDANSFLMSSGVPSAKFPSIGTSISGTITQEPELQQQADFDTGELLTWPDGKARMQARVLLQTEQRDPEIADDDGIRAIYIKSNMQKSVAQAVRAAGANRLEVGGTLTVTYSADGVAQGRKNPPKLYQATYQKPDPVAQAAEPGSSAANGSSDVPPGIDAAVWASMSEEQKAALRKTLGDQPPF